MEKNDLRFFAGLKAFALAAFGRLQINPLNIMLRQHRMRISADVDSDLAAFFARYRDMLFPAGVNCAWYQLAHFLAAAAHRFAGITDKAHQITAFFTQ